jgi:hypothetical protein
MTRPPVEPNPRGQPHHQAPATGVRAPGRLSVTPTTEESTVAKCRSRVRGLAVRPQGRDRWEGPPGSDGHHRPTSARRSTNRWICSHTRWIRGGVAESAPGGPPPPPTGESTVTGATAAHLHGPHRPSTAPSAGFAVGTARAAPGGPPAGWSTRRRRVNTGSPRPRSRDTGVRASEGRGGGGTRRRTATGDLGGGDLEVGGGGEKKGGRRRREGERRRTRRRRCGGRRGRAEALAAAGGSPPVTLKGDVRVGETKYN